VVGCAQGPAVHEDVKIVDVAADFSSLRNPTVEAVAQLDVVGAD